MIGGQGPCGGEGPVGGRHQAAGPGGDQLNHAPPPLEGKKQPKRLGGRGWSRAMTLLRARISRGDTSKGGNWARWGGWTQTPSSTNLTGPMILSPPLQCRQAGFSQTGPRGAGTEPYLPLPSPSHGHCHSAKHTPEGKSKGGAKQAVGRLRWGGVNDTGDGEVC